MADADADEYEEALYTDDEADLNIPIVIEDNTERGGERVVKQSFPGLIKFHHGNPEIKARFIEVVKKFIINNTEIAARASMLLQYIVMYCVGTNRELPANFCSRAFIGQVINFTRRPPILSDDAIHAAYGDDDFVPPFPNLTGRPWLFGYLETMFRGNIEASTILKWKAVVDDSISAYASIHLRQASKQVIYRTTK